jgi:hypothetical protein
MILIIHLRQLEITEWGIANLLYLLRFQHADMPMLSTNDNITVASHPFSLENLSKFALKVKIKQKLNVARLWVDCFDYQSNTVIIAELVLRGRPQPVHKACHESDRLFLF